MISALAILLLYQVPAAPSRTVQSSEIRKPAASAAASLVAPVAPSKTDAPALGGGAQPLATFSGPSSRVTLQLASSQPLKAGAGRGQGLLILPPTTKPLAETFSRPATTWYVLTGLEHGAATYDAWSTRRAVASGRVEADPAMAPFAHSSAIYGVIQLVPLGLDCLGRRMQRDAGWTRHAWWIPQALATATYLFSGSYNAAHTP